MGFTFNVFCLFPEIVKGFIEHSLIKKAKDKGLLKFNILNIRDFTEDRHRQVDDEPYGGGYGMVIKPEPVIKGICSLKEDERGKVILLSAGGKKLNHTLAKSLAEGDALTIVCGRYEGIDNRVLKFIDHEISIGDYVIMGGEIASCVVIEAVARFIKGVVGKEESVKSESFYDVFLEYPHYTRPNEFMGMKVPEVLLSGDHKRIERWRKEKAIEKTVKNRMDVILERKRPLESEEVRYIQKVLGSKYEMFVGLVHYPVYNKKREIVSTAITNMDIHDISRVCRTYGVKRYFIITPDFEQRAYAHRVINHWRYGYGREFNPTRKEALEVVELVHSFEEARSIAEKMSEKPLLCVGTSAKAYKNQITFSNLKELMEKYSVFLVFGTGWGLSDDFKDSMDYMLEPIYGTTDFNHLSVRSAVSIIVDRVCGF